MQQELFRIPLPDWIPVLGPELPIFGYGLMLVIGFYCGLQLMRVLARRSGLDPDIFVNVAVVALVFGIAGARLSHVLENFEQYTDPDRTAWANFLDAVNIRSGGLTFFGGLLLATPACIAYGVWRKVPLRLGMDVVAPALMLALCFGRIGCFLNGCCYGAPCDLPWAVSFPYHSNAYLDQVAKKRIDDSAFKVIPQGDGVRSATLAEAKADPVLSQLLAEKRPGFNAALPVHPSQLYSAFNALLISAALVAFFTLQPAPGRVFALMLILKGMTRFILEMLRDEPRVLGDLSYSMVISIPLFIAGVVMWYVVGRMDPSRPQVATIASARAGGGAPVPA
jgi:phosphatidylglycerol:prolipoprotein diacylglycerol transferase